MIYEFLTNEQQIVKFSSYYFIILCSYMENRVFVHWCKKTNHKNIMKMLQNVTKKCYVFVYWSVKKKNRKIT